MGGGLSVLASTSVDDLPQTDPAICKHKFCEKWSPNHFHCADCQCTIDDEELMREEDRIIDSIVDNSMAEDGVNRGVTIQFLVDFATACNCWDMTTRDVRRRFVMPATRSSRCRFVELPEMSGVVGRATTFVSHTWGAKFGDLVAALCDGNADRSRVVWVDIFAVRQWPSRKPDLDFSAVVRQCKSFVIVCSSVEGFDYSSESLRAISDFPQNVRLQISFLRVWCLVEVHAAILSGCAIVMKAGARCGGDDIGFNTNFDMLFVLSLIVDIEAADATVALDKDRILNEIKAGEGGIAAVNEIVRGVLGGGSSCSESVVQCAACGDVNAQSELFHDPSKYIVSVAGCGYFDLLKLLIDNGADVNVEDEGKNALTVAAFGGFTACVELLIKNGSDVAKADSGGYFALACAALGGHIECIDLVLSHGADINAVSNGGMTALLAAALVGRTSSVRLLIEKGCDLKATDMKGMTALMLAADYGSASCVELLLKAGSDVTAVNCDNENALAVSTRRGHLDCIGLLESSSSQASMLL